MWFITFATKAIITSGILWSYYWLALRNRQFHRYNRFYLLMAAILPFAVPFIQIPLLLQPHHTDSIVLRGVVYVSGVNDYNVSVNPEAGKLSWTSMLNILLATSAAIFLLRFLMGIIRIRLLKKQNPGVQVGDIVWHNTTHKLAPFSFFKHLFWHTAIDPSSTQGDEILHHELAHINQGHSIDKILTELLLAIGCWNPFYWLIRRELSHIHEFIADEEAARAQGGRLAYAENLVQAAILTHGSGLINPFFSPPLKRRIRMLLNNKNARWSYARRLLVLPLSLFVITFISFRVQGLAQKAAPDKKITVVIDAGHGGADNGALSATNVKEDELALKLALDIKKEAESRGIKVIMTRDKDEMPGGTTDKNAALRNRVELVKSTRADCFISIHMDATVAAIKAAGGPHVFVAKNASPQSLTLASAVINAMHNFDDRTWQQVQRRNGEGIYVLDKNPVPAILIQAGSMTDATDLKRMQGTEYRAFLSGQIVNGIVAAANQKFTASTSEKPEELTLVEPDKTTANGFSATSDKAVMVVGKAAKPTAIIYADSVVFDAEKKVTTLHTGEKVIEIKAVQEKQPVVVEGRASVNILNGRVDGKPEPLYVVDGVVVERDVMNTMPPENIASVTVLKDQSATSLYGERGANGVIMIVTKQPGAPKPKLEEVVVRGYPATKPKVEEVVVRGYATPKPKEMEEVVVVGYGTKKSGESGPDRIFTEAEVAPQFPGGAEGWKRYLQRNMKYPALATEKSRQGTVRIQFVVQTDGSIAGVKPLTDLGYGLEEEVIRLLINGPKWTPAMQNGHTVAFRTIQSVTFNLQAATYE